MKVLIMDGENRSALAAVRSLGRRGHGVFVAGGRAQTLASSSGFCQAGVQVPDPCLNGTAYLAAVKKIVAEHRVEMVLPMTDQSIQLLSSIKDDLPGVEVACPSHDMVQAASNKFQLFRLAQALDVPIPKTLFLDSADQLFSGISRIDQYPVVVKPAFSKTWTGGGFLSGGVHYADTPGQLQSLYATEKSLHYSSLIQERIHGPGTGLFTLFDGDRHLALFSHRRLREKPPSGGVSVVCESIPLDDEMVEASRRLLSSIGWRGVAMVEFKRDLRDGKAKLMEINGRFWGSLQLAISCGVDFPALLLDYLGGKSFDRELRSYRQGVKMKWILGTLDHLLIRLKYSPGQLNLPPDAPSKWGALREFLQLGGKDTTYDVLDRRDLAPFRYELREYLGHLCRWKTRRAGMASAMEKSA